jgi:hypothetical protein
MKLTKEEIYRELSKHYASEPEKILREASYNLALASISGDELMLKASRAIERLKQYGNSPDALQASKSQKPVLSYCPICKFEMVSVKLLDDKPAWHCPDHRITVPKPVEE